MIIVLSFLEKDLGFLRIGSLNVRVKKTTEAFSNFLGVGGSSGSITPIDHVLEKVHKSWGSADNVSKVKYAFFYSFLSNLNLYCLCNRYYIMLVIFLNV